MTAINAFAGPGGWEEGARLLGLDVPIVGVDVNEDACTAAVTAGHRRWCTDIRNVDPTTMPEVTGAILSSPCPTFSASGRRTGLGDDYQMLLDAITCAGSDCDHAWTEVLAQLVGVADPRTALAAQVIRFALHLPNLHWLACEQVPSAEFMFEDIAAELYAAGWESADVITADAIDFGLPVRRTRVFLVARRNQPLGVPGGGQYPKRLQGAPTRTLAEVLGWEPGHTIRTRGQRRATGGNLFSADGPSWCLTEKARTWTREADGYRLTPSEAGHLQGFRRDYPWTGSRTRQFAQLADVVCPPVAAAVLGYTTGTPWVPAVTSYLHTLYGPTDPVGCGDHSHARGGQIPLFAAG